ncbi:MAG: hypothetical protein US90_C0018G0035 [Candidatus Shapirobacteria bacterium GW2011_GWE2_38_30]|uniref:Uncharacterized protein n=1 Tax=Candidatus Shapirobacteria bacterium GW2011_GWE2_38_30 TaxID=1618490 RepID=A0A0G0MW96_9BACT|nr:MAG: hypothetical protein US90_C0018G0035 [Candidatus Shapirobacteria bacterium GW2011_GWE2_38_30]
MKSKINQKQNKYVRPTWDGFLSDELMMRYEKYVVYIQLDGWKWKSY